MSNINLEYFKKLLEKEKNQLLSQLKRFAWRSNKTDDWQPKPNEINIQTSEYGEVSDAIDEMAKRIEIEKSLEGSLHDVNSALNKIEKGTYGVCEKKGEPISEERLKANPTARTCSDHF